MRKRFLVEEVRNGRHCAIDDNRLREIVITEGWANDIHYDGLTRWAITDDGHLFLLDDMRNWACPPSGRFTVAWF